ncbi:uncharacterized protein [Asterias amurensis]|uniref:uncharacterized protein n=1 Tax=Asterias amurensis TaxID=7602 RepID=UPI003AB89466
MNRCMTALLLLSICLVVSISGTELSVASCQQLADQVKSEGKKRWEGPIHTFCGETLTEKKTAYCQCGLVPRKRELEMSEFLNRGKANGFLSARNVQKRGLTEECCNEGCYWEEIEETC